GAALRAPRAVLFRAGHITAGCCLQNGRAACHRDCTTARFAEIALVGDRQDPSRMEARAFRIWPLAAATHYDDAVRRPDNHDTRHREIATVRKIAVRGLDYPVILATPQEASQALETMVAQRDLLVVTDENVAPAHLQPLLGVL